MAQFHGNSRKSDKSHHLYEIHDRAEDTTFKYGISGQPLHDDGTSPRANEQVFLYNRVVGWMRFFSSILVKDIDGREKAEALERQFIAEYEKQHGQRPRGNPEV